jgi:chemotaxis protein methyltransferase CheR
MAITSQDFNYIRNIVHQYSAIVLEPGKEYLVESRLQLLVHGEGANSVQDLLRRLRGDSSGELHRKVAEIMMTAETTFFRDVRPFETLKKTVLPQLLERRTQNRSLNIWCAASATGQEPYSIAMLLHDSFPLLASWNVQFIASDLSKTLLLRARKGSFTQLEVNRGLPAVLLVKYFQKNGTEWQIDARIRDMVDFREINLVKPWPCLPAMDVVFLRNVLIYFDMETRRNILARVAHILKPDGFLFLGGSETVTQLEEIFEPIAPDVNACFRLRRAES